MILNEEILFFLFLNGGIFSRISSTESLSTLLSQVNRRDGGNGVRRSRDGGGQGCQNLSTQIERIKCKKVFWEKLADEPEAGGWVG